MLLFIFCKKQTRPNAQFLLKRRMMKSGCSSANCTNPCQDLMAKLKVIVKQKLRLIEKDFFFMKKKVLHLEYYSKMFENDIGYSRGNTKNK